ncbi:hypothetical protein [Phytomonospora endophytica]|uniref:Uncharacterized protein n=1 Tax=Phytomonospora endophytica TaxID=714109 RepID=A0A841FVF3_9ACTN|nr:hypothetical protein [Phytomonospora endophytica]MBB6035960.1 hypothetical protein [Phytomonospora endophytica]GIG66866.1 hypothetical protein Pen01_31610 [Phytomonospora endophytica]
MCGFALDPADAMFISAPPPGRARWGRRVRVLAAAVGVLPLAVAIPAVEEALEPMGVLGLMVPWTAALLVWSAAPDTAARRLVVDAWGIAVAEADGDFVRFAWPKVTAVLIRDGLLFAEVGGERPASGTYVLCRLAWVRPGPAEVFAAIERHSAGRLRPG